MRKTPLLLFISLFLSICFAVAQASEPDLYPLSRGDLEQFSAEVESAQSQYHLHLSGEEKDAVLSAVQHKTEEYIIEQGLTDASWPWFDYTYARQWNLLSVETEVKATDADQAKHSIRVYGEGFPFDGDFELVYLRLDDTEIVNRRQELPEPLWSDIKTHRINARTGLDLTVLSDEQLGSLREEIDTAISQNHRVSKEGEAAVNKLVEESVNDHFLQQGLTVKWPWFGYDYTCDWAYYTEKTEVTCRDAENKKTTHDVYAEVCQNGSVYELVYLLIGENVVIDLRENIQSESYQVYQSSKRFATAQSMLAEGKYAEAREQFQALGDFSNSQAMAHRCTEYLMEADYGKAAALLEGERFEEARQAFLSLGDYGDSAEKARLCQDKLNEIQYNDACSLMQGKQYETALSLFEALGDYADSAAKADQCAEAMKEARYQAACDLRDRGLYTQALAVFSELETYKDSADQAVSCKDAENQRQYETAVAAMDAGEYRDALAILAHLGDYMDAPVLAVTCQEELSEAAYAQATRMKAGGHYDEAHELFASLGDYADSAEMAEQCLVSKANIDRTIGYPEKEITIYLGKTFRLIPTVERLTETAPEKSKISYRSSDTSIVRVTKDGTINTIKDGTVSVFCATEDNPDNITELTVHVVLPVKSVKLSASNLTISMDSDDPTASAVTLPATVSPETAYDPSLTWTSSNENVARVDETGKITPVGAGSATITATANDRTNGVRKAACTVKVKMAVTGIALDKQEGVVFVGKTENLKATIRPENAADRTVTWSSSDKSIATVSSSGVVKGISSGTATITATTSNGLESSFIATVKQGPATFSVSVKATRVATNHVGNEWSTSFEVDNKKFSGSTTFTAEVGQVVHIGGEIVENDKRPDYGGFDVSLTMSEEVFQNGYTEEQTVYVEENGGRYSGNCAEWRVVITVKKR